MSALSVEPYGADVGRSAPASIYGSVTVIAAGLLLPLA